MARVGGEPAPPIPRDPCHCGLPPPEAPPPEPLPMVPPMPPLELDFDRFAWCFLFIEPPELPLEPPLLMLPLDAPLCPPVLEADDCAEAHVAKPRTASDAIAYSKCRIASLR